MNGLSPQPEDDPPPVASNLITLDYIADDGDSGLDSVELFVSHDSNSGIFAGTYVSYGTFTSSPITLTGQNDGSYSFYTIATDIAGNVEQAPIERDISIMLDTTAPTSSIQSNASSFQGRNEFTLEYLSADSGSGIDSVELFYSVDGGAPISYGPFIPSGSIDVFYFIASEDGVHDFYTIATDKAGNTESVPESPDFSLLIDMTPPVSVVSIGDEFTSIRNVDYAFLDVEVSDAGYGIYATEVFYQKNGGGYVKYPSYNMSDPYLMFSVPINGDGAYDFYAVSTDLSNNIEAAPASPEVTIIIDRQEPTSLVSGPSGSLVLPSDTFDVEYTASDNSSFSAGLECVELFYQRNGGGFVSYGTFTSSPISFDTSGTGGDGSYDFYTIATDVAGNAETKSPTAETTVTFNDNTSVDDWLILND